MVEQATPYTLYGLGLRVTWLTKPLKRVKDTGAYKALYDKDASHTLLLLSALCNPGLRRRLFKYPQAEAPAEEAAAPADEAAAVEPELERHDYCVIGTPHLAKNEYI